MRKDAKFESKRTDLQRWHRIEIGPGVTPEQAIAAFKALPEVEVAEPNYQYHLAVLPNLPENSTDPDYSQQWHLANTRVPEAWQYLRDQGINPGGRRDVVVAVIDTGVDYNHADLRGNLWINSSEIPGNGIDEDGNGFIDDIHGCSVVSDPRSHSGDPIDQHGHGTHVAGIIAAQAHNQAGGVGIAFNTQIMAIRAAQIGGRWALRFPVPAV